MEFFSVVCCTGRMTPAAESLSVSIIGSFFREDPVGVPRYRSNTRVPRLVASGPGCGSTRQIIVLSRARLVRLAPQEGRDVQQLFLGPAGGESILRIEPAQPRLCRGRRLGRRGRHWPM